VNDSQKIDRILTLLEGTAAAPQRGLIVRVDRLEQQAQRATWWTRTFIVAWITATAGGIAAAFGFKSQ
jgi:hypothetical protein